jgi:hypothetical protein
LQALQAAAETDEIAAVIADGAAPNVFADTPAPDRLLRWLDAPFQRVAFQVWSMMGVTGPLPVTEAVRRIAPRPVLLIAGARSNYEQDMQRKFYESAGAGCSLWEVPEAGHTESWAMRTEEYGERMLALFNPALL